MATFYVVRHAKAGDRSEWTGDDRLRPLTRKGLAQAEKLVNVLDAFPIKAVFSSPYLRCVQTVEPLARAHSIEVQASISLAEGHGLDGAMRFMRDPKLDGAVLCTHADIVWEIVESLVQRKVVQPGEGGYDKGSVWVVEVRNGEPRQARFIPAP